jgi:hypothetical protein
MSRDGLSAVTSKPSASLRHQRVLLVKGRLGDGHTGPFEVICCACGDHASLGYSQVPVRPQRLRGQYDTIEGLPADRGRRASPGGANPARSE